MLVSSLLLLLNIQKLLEMITSQKCLPAVAGFGVLSLLQDPISSIYLGQEVAAYLAQPLVFWPIVFFYDTLSLRIPEVTTD